MSTLTPLSLSLHSILTAWPWRTATVWPLSLSGGGCQCLLPELLQQPPDPSSRFCLRPQYHTKESSCPSSVPARRTHLLLFLHTYLVLSGHLLQKSWILGAVSHESSHLKRSSREHSSQACPADSRCSLVDNQD